MFCLFSMGYCIDLPRFQRLSARFARFPPACPSVNPSSRQCGGKSQIRVLVNVLMVAVQIQGACCRERFVLWIQSSECCVHTPYSSGTKRGGTDPPINDNPAPHSGFQRLVFLVFFLLVPKIVGMSFFFPSPCGLYFVS